MAGRADHSAAEGGGGDGCDVIAVSRAAAGTPPRQASRRRAENGSATNAQRVRGKLRARAAAEGQGVSLRSVERAFAQPARGWRGRPAITSGGGGQPGKVPRNPPPPHPQMAAVEGLEMLEHFHALRRLSARPPFSNSTGPHIRRDGGGAAPPAPPVRSSRRRPPRRPVTYAVVSSPPPTTTRPSPPPSQRLPPYDPGLPSRQPPLPQTGLPAVLSPPPPDLPRLPLRRRRSHRRRDGDGLNIRRHPSSFNP